MAYFNATLETQRRMTSFPERFLPQETLQSPLYGGRVVKHRNAKNSRFYDRRSSALQRNTSYSASGQDMPLKSDVMPLLKKSWADWKVHCNSKSTLSVVFSKTAFL